MIRTRSTLVASTALLACTQPATARVSRGNTEAPGVLFRRFRGRDPIIEPLLIERGLKGATP